MSGSAIAYYQRRLAEARAAVTASHGPARADHQLLVGHYEELLRLERFSVDTITQPPALMMSLIEALDSVPRHQPPIPRVRVARYG